jgi:hypothetical protein
LSNGQCVRTQTERKCPQRESATLSMTVSFR